MMSLTFGLFSQMSASAPHGPLVILDTARNRNQITQIRKTIGLWGGGGAK